MTVKKLAKPYMALSVRQPYAEMIASGKKVIEFRSWYTDYLGELLIVASKTPDDGGEYMPKGVAICLVSLDDIEELTYTDDTVEYEWKLSNPRRVEPVKIRGKVKLFTVEKNLIRLS